MPKATITLTEEEIKAAITEYLDSRAVKHGKVNLIVVRGYAGDCREPGTPDSITASIEFVLPLK